MSDKDFRWIATASYRSSELGPMEVEYHLEELEALSGLIERGPDWNTIEQIVVRLNPRRATYARHDRSGGGPVTCTRSVGRDENAGDAMIDRPPRPVRLQLSRRNGFRLQDLSRQTNGLPAVSVARPGQWGNPFKGVGAAERFACEIASTWDLSPLRGKNLACWCKPSAPCHADTLVKLANG
jgi:hypothetical protein